MNDAMSIFDALISQCSTCMGLYEYLESNGIPVDSSDLLRWQYVLAVSALDKYIHDIVRIYMLEIYRGNRIRTKKYDTVRFDLATIEAMKTSATPEVEFTNEIIRQHGYLSFQDPDRISDALSLIWEENNKWLIISSNMSYHISQCDLKIKLKNIVLRRNQIVHQGDSLTTQTPLQQQIILREDVEDVINFVVELVKAIDKSLA